MGDASETTDDGLGWGDVPETEAESEEPEPDEEPEDADHDDADDEEPEPDVAEAELGDDDFGGDDLFNDIEDADTDGDADRGDPMDELGAGGGAIKSAVNNGAARAAIAGLEDSDELQEEFQGIFEAFRLGYFGQEFASEYLFVGDEEDIDPAWGLLGSMLCCCAVVLWMRPDGDEQIERLQDAVGGIAGGAA